MEGAYKHEKGLSILALIGVLGAVAVIALISYSAGNSRAGSDIGVSGAINPTSTVSVGTSTRATATKQAKQAKANTPAPSVPNVPKTSASTASVTSAVTASVAAEPTGRSCSANDLVGTASWEKIGSYIAGNVRVRNTSGSDCVLSWASALEIQSGSSTLVDNQISSPDKSVIIARGGSQSVRFTWFNWCGSDLARQAYVRLVFPGSLGYLRVPLIDADGNPQSDSPECTAPQGSSSVYLWW